MSSTTTPPETEVKKIEADAKTFLQHIEDFFAHLLLHTPSASHAAIQAAQAATVAAVPQAIASMPVPPASPPAA